MAFLLACRFSNSQRFLSDTSPKFDCCKCDNITPADSLFQVFKPVSSPVQQCTFQHPQRLAAVTISTSGSLFPADSADARYIWQFYTGCADPDLLHAPIFIEHLRLADTAPQICTRMFIGTALQVCTRMFVAERIFVDCQRMGISLSTVMSHRKVDSEAKEAEVSLLYWCTRWQKSVVWAAVDVQCDNRALHFGPIHETTRREIVKDYMTAWVTSLADEQVFAKCIASMFVVRATVDFIAENLALPVHLRIVADRLFQHMTCEVELTWSEDVPPPHVLSVVRFDTGDVVAEVPLPQVHDSSVSMLAGESITVPGLGSMSVALVKAMIHDLSKIPAAEQCLTLDGQITDSSPFPLFLCLRGGGQDANLGPAMRKKKLKVDQRAALALEPRFAVAISTAEWVTSHRSRCDPGFLNAVSLPLRGFTGIQLTSRAGVISFMSAYSENEDVPIRLKKKQFNAAGAHFVCPGEYLSDTGCGFNVRWSATKSPSPGAGRVWTCNTCVLDCGCGFAQDSSWRKSWPPYSQKQLARVICMPHVSSSKAERLNERAATALLQHVVKVPPIGRTLTDVRNMARRLSQGQSPTRPLPGEVSIDLDAALADLFWLVEGLRAVGHIVDIITVGAEVMRLQVLDASRAKINAMRKGQGNRKGLKKIAPFNAAEVKKMDAYRSIVDGEEYFYAVAFGPSTAEHMANTTRRISQADMAHIKGFCGGNIAWRFTSDANHHQILLAAVYILGTENRAAWDVLNIFTKKVCPGFDDTRQCDITDGDKGAAASSDVTLPATHHFNCANHVSDNLQKKFPKNCGLSDLDGHPTRSIAAKYLFRDAVGATSNQALDAIFMQMPFAVREYLKPKPVFPVKIGACLHGLTTSSGVESQNAAGRGPKHLNWRSSDTAVGVLQGVLQQVYTQQHDAACAAAACSDKLPKTVADRLKADELKAAEYTCTQVGATQSVQVIWKLYQSNLSGPSAVIPHYTVDLSHCGMSGCLDWDHVCCDRAKLHHRPCLHMLAAARFAGMPRYQVFDRSDFAESWKAQHRTSAPNGSGSVCCPKFRIPTRGPRPGSGTPVDANSLWVLLTADATAKTLVRMPLVIGRNRGRPPQVRAKAWRSTSRAAKPIYCSRCGNMVTDHDARTCQGLHEVPTPRPVSKRARVTVDASSVPGDAGDSELRSSPRALSSALPEIPSCAGHALAGMFPDAGFNCSGWMQFIVLANIDCPEKPNHLGVTSANILIALDRMDASKMCTKPVFTGPGWRDEHLRQQWTARSVCLPTLPLHLLPPLVR